MIHSIEIAGRSLLIESQKYAKQASGAVTIRYGDTAVLVTAVTSEQPTDKDFLPLVVEYREQSYAAGRIPGGFFKREGRPSDKEILSSRLIDRSVRPLFPEHLRNEIQVIAIVLSFDQENDGDVLGVIGASCAIAISENPFFGPVGCVRIGSIGGQHIINPTIKELDESSMNMLVAGTKAGITMIEAGIKEVSEDDVIQAIALAKPEIDKIIAFQEEISRQIGKPKFQVESSSSDEELEELVRSIAMEDISGANQVPGKRERQDAFQRIRDRVAEKLGEDWEEKSGRVTALIEKFAKADMRQRIVKEKKRVDGRGPDDIRPISCEVATLPRTHGSALFTRGETQSLVVTTLGTTTDEQIVDALEGESSKSFMLHYNFLPFSVGEVRMLRGPGRREIGHGYLSEKALEPLIPPKDTFPYTIRVVSDILESNGSSSMATVCGASLSLMDAGIPIKAPVAGLSIGLVREGDQEVLLTDIIGLEDHFGDMDFKVAGTRSGITAIQLDTKTHGVGIDTLGRALARARIGRHFVLDTMERTLAKPRDEMSEYAPKVQTLAIPKEKIGEVIGPGGRVIRGIVEQTGAKIDIDDSMGKVTICAPDSESAEKAAKMIEVIIAEVEVGKLYIGTVKKILTFGAVVEILPGREGMIHISEIAPYRVKNVRDVLKEGDEVVVKVKGMDQRGKIQLSRKAALGRSVSTRPDRKS